jgi:Protein of unknown function (DUF559)
MISGLLNVKRGHPTKDLSPELGHHLWQSQQTPEMLLVSDSTKYMWVLGCHKHLRFMTVQAALRQTHDPKHPCQLTACERCSSSYRLSGPEPTPRDMHRSFWEGVAWLNLEHVLEMGEVKSYMSKKTQQHGEDLGYVVEARVVQGWNAGVDIYVPGLKLVIQVDGQHHDEPPQQTRDANFNMLAITGGHRVLRLHFRDVHTMVTDILTAVTRCMQCTDTPWLICTKHHPLCHVV